MYIDETYLTDTLGTAKLAALCPSSGELAAVIAQATAETRSALTQGGYSVAVPETVYATIGACPDEIKLACFGAFVELAYGRNDLQPPENYRAYIAKVEELKRGSLEIPNVPKVVSRAVGGVAFTESSTQVSVASGSRPQVFNRNTMSGF